MRAVASHKRSFPFGARRAAGSARPWAAAVAAAMLLSLVLGIGVARAGKAIETTWGNAAGGSSGGLFSNPGDIAVRESTGQVFLVDTDNNRVQRFDSAGNFERAWGWDVVRAGGSGDVSGDEQQKLTLAASGGAFTLAFRRTGGSEQITGGIPYNASAAQLQSILVNLSNLDPGEVAVSGPAGGPWEIEFSGALAGVDVRPLRPDGGQLSGDPVAADIDTIADGGGFEVCAVASECKAGAENGSGGSIGRPRGIVVNQENGHVYVSGETQGRITEFDGDGSFVRTFGWNVVKPGGVGDAPGNERQVIAKLLDRDNGKPPTSGTFQLSWRSQADAGCGSSPESPTCRTSPLPYDATAAEIESALEALPGLAPADIAVGGPAAGPWTVDFAGSLAGTDVPDIEGVSGINSPCLAGPFQPSFWPDTGSPNCFPADMGRAISDGGSYEVCTVASDCNGASAYSSGAAGQLETVQSGALAIDRDSGDLFVASGRRINEFHPDGSFVRAFGWGVDSGDDQFEVCTAATTCEAGPKVKVGVDFPAFGQTFTDATLAVDSAGTVYAATQQNGTTLITRFDSTKTAASELLLPGVIADTDPSESCGYCTPGPLPHGAEPRGLEVEATSDHLLYLSSAGVLELDTSPLPATVVDAHLPGANVFFGGFGLDEILDRFYVSVSDSAVGERILVLGNTPGAPQVGEIEAASGIGATSATLHGRVTPNGPAGIDTSYRFEYSTDGVKWIRVPIPDEALGDGTSPVTVSKPISGLEANQLYHVRLVATKSFGLGTVTTPEVTFTTLQLPPTVKTIAPQARSSTEAGLTALVNANNLPTSYYFEYGLTTAYGSKVPVPDGVTGGGQAMKIVEQVTGLEPATTYHYRIVATNGLEQSPGDSLIEGGDVTFTTRPLASVPESRAYEMVTPPFKVVRAAPAIAKPPRNNANPGMPSLSGDTVAWQVLFFPLTEDVGWPANNDRRIIRRTAEGWVNETQNTRQLMPNALSVLLRQDPIATSGDFETLALTTNSGTVVPDAGGILPTEGPIANRLYTFRRGTGVDGYTPWLTNPSKQVIDLGQSEGSYGSPEEQGVINDDGSAMARWGSYGGLEENYGTPANEDPSDDQPLLGKMAYIQRAADPEAMPTSPKDLVSECTGSGSTATQVPSRNASNLIVTRPCAEGALTQRRGGVLGGGQPYGSSGNTLMAGTAQTALSNDGARAFFESPDPLAAPTVCNPEGFGVNTNCPPQLFVRQYAADNTPTVRWISHSRSVAEPENGFSGPLIAGQSTTEMGSGTLFQGASRNGDTVYFQTSAPLVPSDPNGGASITAGSAQDSSWDLYRYQLPPSLEEDPDKGTLTRITGGPSGSADPNTNGANGGGSARYVSDDGSRVYFVTNAPIAGADATSPAGGATEPGGTADNTATRNLYLFDDHESGAAKYRFIAKLPLAGPLAACATLGKLPSFYLGQNDDTIVSLAGANCFRGTPDGRYVVFATDGQLTPDDTDLASDIYLYDAVADDLTRISAPPSDAEPYMCAGDALHSFDSPPAAGQGCNADLGFSPASGLSGAAYGSSGGRGWGGMRYYNVSQNPDGSLSVFFQSRAELLPADTNGDYWDVYEWRNGALSLISPGNSEDDSWFSGNGVDGRDVFFWTSARIDPREIDDADFDIYDARRGSSGFPYTPPATPCDVLGLACEGGAVSPAARSAPSTAAFSGAGNPASRCRKGQLKKKGRCVKARHKKHHQGRSK